MLTQATVSTYLLGRFMKSVEANFKNKGRKRRIYASIKDNKGFRKVVDLETTIPNLSGVTLTYDAAIDQKAVAKAYRNVNDVIQALDDAKDYNCILLLTMDKTGNIRASVIALETSEEEKEVAYQNTSIELEAEDNKQDDKKDENNQDSKKEEQPVNNQQDDKKDENNQDSKIKNFLKTAKEKTFSFAKWSAIAGAIGITTTAGFTLGYIIDDKKIDKIHDLLMQDRSGPSHLAEAVGVSKIGAFIGEWHTFFRSFFEYFFGQSATTDLFAVISTFLFIALIFLIVAKTVRAILRAIGISREAEDVALQNNNKSKLKFGLVSGALIIGTALLSRFVKGPSLFATYTSKLLVNVANKTNKENASINYEVLNRKELFQNVSNFINNTKQTAPKYISMALNGLGVIVKGGVGGLTNFLLKYANRSDKTLTQDDLRTVLKFGKA